jgi:hypothetical protein
MWMGGKSEVSGYFVVTQKFYFCVDVFCDCICMVIVVNEFVIICNYLCCMLVL